MTTVHDLFPELTQEYINNFSDNFDVSQFDAYEPHFFFEWAYYFCEQHKIQEELNAEISCIKSILPVVTYMNFVENSKLVFIARKAYRGLLKDTPKMIQFLIDTYLANDPLFLTQIKTGEFFDSSKQTVRKQ